MNGPPLAIYGASRGWSPRRFRAPLQGYFLPVSPAGLIRCPAVGLRRATLTRYFILSLPAVVIALLLGRSISGRISGPGFFRFVYGSLVAAGSVLTAQAIAK